MLVSRIFPMVSHIGIVQGLSLSWLIDRGVWAAVAMDRRQVFDASLGWRRRVIVDEGSSSMTHGWARASEAKFGHERRRMGEFPRETRPMLCIGKTPVTFVFAASPQKRSFSASRMDGEARGFWCGEGPRSHAERRSSGMGRPPTPVPAVAG